MTFPWMGRIWIGLGCRQQCEEQKVTCSSLETALQARQAQDALMASQLRAAQHLLQCEKLETQALSQQVSPYPQQRMKRKEEEELTGRNREKGKKKGLCH